MDSNSIIVTPENVMNNIKKVQESIVLYKTAHILNLLKSLLNAFDSCHSIELTFDDNISFDSIFYNV